MPMLAVSASELASIQADSVAAACDQTCQIYRKTTTAGTAGEPLASWALAHTTVCGLAEPSAGQLANYDFLIGSLAAWQVRLPVGTDVQEQDHLVIPATTGQTLEVMVLLDPHSYPALLKVLAVERK